jgi:hypothetical protein
MKYQVPQFIEIEDKIIGGILTLKQGIYIGGGAGMCFIIYKFVYVYAAYILIPAVIGLSLALAFYKVNNKPFIDVLEAAFLYYTKKNLYIWKKEDKKVVQKTQEPETPSPQAYVPRLSESKLKDLAWTLDINENLSSSAGKNGDGVK